MTEPVATEVGRDFIRDIIQADLDQAKYQEIVTRFPPEPNGYLHIGHAKSIALNFGIAQEFPGRCHLRFDDTNPVKEEQEYIDSIQADVRWLGFDWGKNLFFASDYFDRLYEWAEQLIRDGLAYVDDQSQEEIRLARGTLTEPGKNSPFRDRTVDENLVLFRRMKAGEFPNGARVLRAKIDMAAGNINLRDPVLYRILHAHHPRTGTKWSIYPSYDYAHGQSDAIEGITHSICTLEFEDHRPLYDWFIEKLPVPSKPHQYEFARLNLTYTLLSKRVLTQLVREGHVAGWDDPRMPTMAGMRRRGVPPAALREFVKRIGVAKANSVVDVGMLEFCIREELNRTSQRRMAVLKPLKVVIENYPEGQTEELEAINHPDDPSAGTRKITFGRELYIEQDDFMENPPKKFFRLSPGNEVRLRYAYFVKCTGVIKNDAGEVVELRCTYDPATKGGNAPDGRKVKATMHWLSAATSVPAEIRVYNQLFANPSPDASNFAADLNPQSLEILADARVEASVAESNSTEVMQFERQGYFVRDRDSTPGKPVFSRTIGLRDTFAKEVAGKEQKENKPASAPQITMECVILVDNSNVYISGQKTSATRKGLASDGDMSWRIDFEKLLAHLANGRKIRKAFLVGSRPPANDKVWEMAKAKGFEVITHERDWQNKEKAVDTELVARGTLAIATTPAPAVLVIASGDRDFIPLVNVAHELKWTVEMCAFSTAFAPKGEMAVAVDRVRPLDGSLDLIGQYAAKRP